MYSVPQFLQKLKTALLNTEPTFIGHHLDFGSLVVNVLEIRGKFQPFSKFQI